MSIRKSVTKSNGREREWALQNALRAIRGLRGLTSPSVETVIAIVASEFRITPQDVTGSSRWVVDVMGRHIAMTLAYLLCDVSATQIGAHFKKVDHTTVLHAFRKYGEEVYQLCVVNGVRAVFDRKKKQDQKREGLQLHYDKAQRKLANSLARLIPWQEAPALGEEIFPHLPASHRTQVLRSLRHHGYVSAEGSGLLIGGGRELLGWRITERGLLKYDELKHLLAPPGIRKAA